MPPHRPQHRIEPAACERIIPIEAPGVGLLGWIALHSTRLGPAFGGIRRWRYQGPEEARADAVALAEAMTLKCAISGVPGGGGKSVLLARDDVPRAELYRALGRAVEALGGRYYTGPDVGTEPDDLEEVARETAYVARAGAGGPGNLAEPTARGVFAGVGAVADRLGRPLRGLRVALQGVGEVGGRLAHLLAEAGAELRVTDLDPERAARVAQACGGEAVAADALLAVECDVFAPCALGGVIDAERAESLPASAVAGSANNVLAEPRAGEVLARRGVLYAPDFVINAGALVHGALFHLDGAAPPPARVDAIGAIVGDLLDRAAATGERPEILAERVARERVAAGGETR